VNDPTIQERLRDYVRWVNGGPCDDFQPGSSVDLAQRAADALDARDAQIERMDAEMDRLNCATVDAWQERDAALARVAEAFATDDVEPTEPS
jgi:hypothetical protein